MSIYAPDVDLALLTLDDPAEEQGFFYDRHTGRSVALAFADSLPDLQERVHVVGFPTGGETICVTEGVVSRIDVRGVSVDGRVDALCIQIDAAINRYVWTRRRTYGDMKEVTESSLFIIGSIDPLF